MLPPLHAVASAQISQHAIASIVPDTAAAASTMAPGCRLFYCATAASELYRVTLNLGDRTITKELLQTAHPARVNDLAFPNG